MKKLILFACALCMSVCAMAQTTFYVYKTDGSAVEYAISDVDSISFTAPADPANWGGAWRMPTDEEWTELRENCTWTWTTLNGVDGYEVKGANGNSIFLPAAGYRYNADLRSAGNYGDYWSSSLRTDYPDFAWYVNFDSGGVYRDGDGRCCGRSVRPVLE